METIIATPITKLLGIRHPIILAGMNVAAGPELAAAVTNAGGLGVIGGVYYTPKFLKEQLDRLKGLVDKNAGFGVDLLLPKVGEGARATNADYTKGALPELIDIIIESKPRLFVSAVGVPPRWVVDKLHGAGILVMNMIGAPKHAIYAMEAGVDIVCAQGGEGGGHTGSIATSILIPKVVDQVKGHKSPLTGEQMPVVAAGGIFDGRGLAMSLALGAQAAWVGTRFVASIESGAPRRHKQSVVKASYDDTVRTLVYTGRPLRMLKNKYVMNWEKNRRSEIEELCSKGIIPFQVDVKKWESQKEVLTEKMLQTLRGSAWGQQVSESQTEATKTAIQAMPLLMGQCAGAINDILPAKVIVESMVEEAASILQSVAKQIERKSKL